MLSLFAAVALLIVAIYVVFPKVVGLDGTFDRFDDATWYWIVLAFCIPVLTLLVRGARAERVRRARAGRDPGAAGHEGVLADHAVGAGGVGDVLGGRGGRRRAPVLGAAQGRDGAPARRVPEVAFLAILYSVYLLALVLFGVLLAAQVLPGEDHLSVTIVPAAIAGG